MSFRGLNLGCGADIRPGFVNLDWVKGEGVDVVHDLDQFPWPFGEDEFDTVLAFDVFEHVDHPIDFMGEAWRILKPEGKLGLRTPAWDAKNSYRDPTHKRWSTEDTFLYWVVDPANWINEKYGHAYARGAIYRQVAVQRVGDNFEHVLQKVVR